jgi:cysteine synthase B
LALPAFGEARVYAKLEFTNPGGSLKDRPVRAILLGALAAGELSGRALIDSSSGNAGIAYAMIGAALGVPVTLVVPGNASLERKRRIRAHGAELIETDPLEGYDAAIHRAHELAASEPERYFLADQYANDLNWRAHYETTGPEIWQATSGQVTHFVAGVGTGGTITGVGRFLKERNPRLRVVAIRPERFPGIEGLKPLGDPADFVPPILDASVVDEWVPVTSDAAAEVCHEIARLGWFVGQSSGAYLAGVRAVLARSRGVDQKRALVVTLLNDIGERYMSTPLWRERV